jgi:hypothetical protein
MSKKLSSIELNVLSNVIVSKVNEEKYEKIKGKIESDSDFLRIKEILEEKRKLNDKIMELGNEHNRLANMLRDNYGVNVFTDYNSGNVSKLKVDFSRTDYNKIYNDLVIMNIGKNIDIESVINSIMEKYVG